MNSERIVQALRVVTLLCIGTLVAVTITQIGSSGVKAPLLTMLGGVTIITVLYPNDAVPYARSYNARLLSTLAGTGIVVLGDFFWMLDETQSNNSLRLEALAIFLPLTLILVVYMCLSMVILHTNWLSVGSIIRRVILRINGGWIEVIS
ncbi:MAG: hypothetical protein OXI16_00970 [Chloroflexota bacterium]|nr:hypothetical protein [Chloroflexota bacterium]